MGDIRLPLARNMESKKDFYCLGKYFSTFEEMMEFNDKWPEMEVDLDYLKMFFDDRFKEAKMNKQANPSFTNRQAFTLLKMSCEWCEREKNDK